MDTMTKNADRTPHLKLIADGETVVIHGTATEDDLYTIYANITNAMKELLIKAYTQEHVHRMLHAAAEYGLNMDPPEEGSFEVWCENKEDRP